MACSASKTDTGRGCGEFTTRPCGPDDHRPEDDPGFAEAMLLDACRLAREARWKTAPNPCVGAILVREGQVVACGFHTGPGNPHAERECLADAREKGVPTEGTTMYVTLEPCNHHGRTPPCTEAILEAGVSRVFIGCMDPNPHVEGGGADFLMQRGVEVITPEDWDPDFMSEARRACRDLIADFEVWQLSDRPYVLLKLAATMDGKIATRTGHSQWVSGPDARKRVHELRSRVNAVLVGGNTFREDNPRLDCRLESEAGAPPRQPLAVVVTTSLPAPDLKDTAGSPYHLLTDRASDTIFLTDENSAASPGAEALREAGLRVWGVPLRDSDDGGGIDLKAGLARLRTETGALTLLCEGGGALGLSMLAQGVVDEFLLFQSPKILGDAAARNLFDGRSPVVMEEAVRLRLCETGRAGDDLMLTYRTR